MTGLPKQITETLTRILPERSNYPLHEPSFTGNEKKYLMDCIDSGFVSSVGEFVSIFEKRVAAFTGSAHAVATVNGTSALHTCLMLADVCPGEEVLMPALTFVATTNAVSYCGAVPHFVDSSPHDLSIDPVKLESYLDTNFDIQNDTCVNLLSGRTVRALICVHVFGITGEMNRLQDICRRYHIKLIEDAAGALGSYYKNQHTGTFGFASALSFNGNKTITSGGGGMILVGDKERAVFAKHLTTTAKSTDKWYFLHDRVGYNYRLPNINAALGCAQMEMLPGLLRKKQKLAQRYTEAFKDIPGVTFFNSPHHVKSNHWLNTLLLASADGKLLDDILQQTNNAGFQTRPVWTPMHRLPMYADCPSMDLSQTESLAQRIINLPSSPDLAAPHHCEDDHDKKISKTPDCLGTSG